MKKLKFLLPLLAFVMAIGMSFASANLDSDPNKDYIFRNNTWQEIDETECNPQKDQCLVLVMPENQTYPVYDEPDFSTAKEGDGGISAVINLP